MATPTSNKVQQAFETLNKKFIETLNAEDIREGAKLFNEHAGGEEDCHHHDHDSHGDHHHSDSEDSFDPAVEDHHMTLACFRAYWCKELFVVQAEMVREAFKVAIEKQIVSRSFFKDVNSVAGFGCGPGSDLVGFLAFLEELPQENQPSTPPVLIGVDAEEGWKVYVEEMGCKFECKSVDTQVLMEMPKYDVIIMCCFASHVRLSRSNEGEKSNWDIVAEKCKLLMVLDFDDATQDAALKERQAICYTVKRPLAVYPGYELNVYVKQFP